jgi:hypothetical protein
MQEGRSTEEMETATSLVEMGGGCFKQFDPNKKQTVFFQTARDYDSIFALQELTIIPVRMFWSCDEPEAFGPIPPGRKLKPCYVMEAYVFVRSYHFSPTLKHGTWKREFLEMSRIMPLNVSVEPVILPLPVWFTPSAVKQEPLFSFEC